MIMFLGLNRERLKKIASKQGAITIGILVFCLFVWPTPYQYFKEGSENIRVNRLTGHVQRLGGRGWYPKFNWWYGD